MPRISQEKEKRIKESILHLLFNNSPKMLFTVQVAKELARDEEYIKKLLLDLHDSNFVIPIKQNSNGQEYSRRIRWRLSNKAFETYKNITDRENRFL